jgi:hypothetical protein
LDLKAQHDALSKEFAQKLDEAFYAGGFLPDKRAKIAEIREYYALRNVDVAAADKHLSEIDEQIKQSAMPGRTRTAGHISITPLHPTAPARTTAPARRAAPPPPAKKAAAKAPVKAPAKVKPAASKTRKKGIKPNKEVDPKAKKKSLFSGDNATVD